MPGQLDSTGFPNTGGALDALLQGVQDTQAAVERISKKKREAMLDTLEIQAKAPLGYQASFGDDGAGGVTANYVPVGMSDPRIQTAIASETAQAKARAEAAAAQFHMELPDRLALQDRQNQPEVANQWQQFLNGISRDFFGTVREGIKQQGAAETARDKALLSFRNALANKGLTLDEQGNIVDLPLSGEAKQKAKADRLSKVEAAATAFAKAGYPQVGAEIGLANVKARGSRVKGAIESLLGGPTVTKPANGPAQGEMGDAAKALDIASKAIDEFIDQNVPPEEKQASMAPDEKAKIQASINAKIDEKRTEVEDHLRARLLNHPKLVDRYMQEYDRRVQKYETDYKQPASKASPKIGERDITDFLAKPENAALVKDTISSIKAIANQNTKADTNGAPIRYTRFGDPYSIASSYGDEAILQARDFMKLPAKRQYEILAHRFLVGTGPAGAPNLPPTQSFRKQPPIPARTTQPR